MQNKTINYVLPVFKGLNMKLVIFKTNWICTFSVRAQSVSSAIFSDALASNYCISINGIASYRITYEENIKISYKLDIPPSPSVCAFQKTKVISL